MVQTLKAALSARERDASRLIPVPEIAVFPAPAPIGISIAVDPLEQCIRRQHHTAEKIFDLVPQSARRMFQRPEPGFGAMPDDSGRRVRPTVIGPHRKIVDIMKAGVIAFSAAKHKADVFDSPPI